MNYTTITQLKKEAKKIRKNNNNIKNHSESLNLIAEEHNFNSWDDLLNHSVLLHKKKTNNDLNLNTIIELILQKHDDFIETMKSKNYKYISYFINENFKNELKNNDAFWADRAKTYLEFVAFLYVNIIPEDKDVDLSLFLYLGELDNVIKELNNDKNEKLKSNKKIINFLKSIPGFNMETAFKEKNLNNDFTIQEQFSYLSMQYTEVFNDIDDIFINILTTKTNKKELLALISNPINLSYLMSSYYFNDKKIFEEYIKTKTDSKSLFDKKLQIGIKEEIQELK